MASILKRNKFEVWCDVIFALFVREIRTGFNDKFGLAWAILNPLSFIFALSFMRGMMDDSSVHGIPVFLFMLYGMLFVQTFLTVMEKTTAAFNKHKALFAFRQVQPMSAYLASACFEILIKIVVAITLLFILYMMKVDIRIDKPIELMMSFILLSINAISLGIIFSIVESKVKEFSRIRSVITRPLFFISGVFFSLQDFSKDIWPYLNWNPILQGIELARGSAYSVYGYHGVSFEYLTIFTICTLFLSLSIYSISWKHMLGR